MLSGEQLRQLGHHHCNPLFILHRNIGIVLAFGRTGAYMHGITD